MLRETNLFGVYFSPLVAYMAAAAIIYVPLHALLGWAGLLRWAWNAPLAGGALYICILGLLVVWF